MRLPDAAAKLLVALAIAVASFGCMAPAAYAQDATATVTSDGRSHIIVDINLHDNADIFDSGSKENSSSRKTSRKTSAKRAKILGGIFPHWRMWNYSFLPC